MYLEVSPTGGNWWRLKYRFGGKEKRLVLGVYPDVKLKDARDRRDAARSLPAKGTDPGRTGRLKSLPASTERRIVSRSWRVNGSPSIRQFGPRTIVRRFERDIFPWIGDRPIAEITAPEILTAVRRIESRGALETAHRALSNCRQVFRYAIATGRAVRDPSSDLRGALPPVKSVHLAATTDHNQIAAILRSA
jgi:hypothetical protein